MKTTRLSGIAAVTALLSIGFAPPAIAAPSTTASSSAWTVVSSPNPDSSNSALDAVAVVSANDVWAVGRAGSKPLAEHWDGSQWSVVPTPNPTESNNNSELLGVTAIASDDVWAVGYGTNTSTGWSTLAEHWDGASWSIVPTPNPPGQIAGPSLNAVAAAGTNDVWAAGGAGLRGYPGAAVLEHWDGTAWSLAAAPAETQTWSSSSRFGVAAVAGNDVWAVGAFDSFHWDGVSWVVVGGEQSTVAAAAAGATDVWTVGSYTYSDGDYTYGPFTLAYRWNGSSWAQSAPVSPTGEDGFQGVVAIAPNDVWAVGTSSSTSTLTEHFDGTGWSQATSASPGNRGNVLYAAAAAGSQDVWAVGSSFSYANGMFTMQTLIEHFTG